MMPEVAAGAWSGLAGPSTLPAPGAHGTGAAPRGAVSSAGIRERTRPVRCGPAAAPCRQPLTLAAAGVPPGSDWVRRTA